MRVCAEGERHIAVVFESLIEALYSVLCSIDRGRVAHKGFNDNTRENLGFSFNYILYSRAASVYIIYLNVLIVGAEKFKARMVYLYGKSADKGIVYIIYISAANIYI